MPNLCNAYTIYSVYENDPNIQVEEEGESHSLLLFLRKPDDNFVRNQLQQQLDTGVTVWRME